MSDLKARAGQPITAEKWNRVIDRLPVGDAASPRGFVRLLLCRTSEEISASTIDASDTADSVYESGTVVAYGMSDNGDGTFSPALFGGEKIMINASEEAIPSGTELWAIETFGGILVSTVWVC